MSFQDAVSVSGRHGIPSGSSEQAHVGGQRGNSSFLSVHKSQTTFRDCHGPMVDRYSTTDLRQSYLATAAASAPALALGSLRVPAVHHLRHCSKSGPEVVHLKAALLRGCLDLVYGRRGLPVYY